MNKFDNHRMGVTFQCSRVCLRRLLTILGAGLLLPLAAGCEFNPYGTGGGPSGGGGGGGGGALKKGACCFSDGTCEQRQESVCENNGGSYAGDNTQCNQDPCDLGFVDNGMQTGACCYGDANGLGCTETTFYECDSFFLGIGTHCPISGNCDDILGACCNMNDGSCAETTEEDCSLEGEVYQGNGTNCMTAACDLVGACCDGEQCVSNTEVECLNMGGEFLGIGVVCQPDTCLTTGACCNFGECVTTMEDVCLSVGGEFLGLGVECEADTCAPTGACVFVLRVQCAILTEDECADQGGIYSGDDTECL